MRAEGKEYLVKDGDVMNFLFNVGMRDWRCDVIAIACRKKVTLLSACLPETIDKSIA